MVRKRETKAINKLCVRDILSLSFVCGAYFFLIWRPESSLFCFIIKFPYNARSDWLKQRPLSEYKGQVNDIKLAFKFLLRNFDKFDPN